MYALHGNPSAHLLVPGLVQHSLWSVPLSTSLLCLPVAYDDSH
jgi:hypothetical protein